MTTLSSPLTPVQSRPERPRAVSSMSHASTQSKRSAKSEAKKLDLTETSQEKRRLHGKADPTKALSEAQPAAVALEEANLADIRGIQHKDAEGNVIVDPDRSNPTRPRMERPLDTIRSFHDAADGTANRRVSSYQRPTIGNAWDNQSRRTHSYYGPPNSMYSPHGRQQPRPGYGGYYRHSAYGYRPESYAEDTASQSSAMAPPPRQQRWHSVPYMPHTDSPSSFHSQQHSYETMTSGSDENSKSTNPSSQNSSFDRLHQQAIMAKRPQDDYGINFQNPDQITPLHVQPPRPMHHHHQQQQQQHDMTRNYGPPPTHHQPVRPPQQTPLQRAPPPPPKNIISLTSSNTIDEYGMSPSARPESKRKSWIRRTFSRRAS